MAGSTARKNGFHKGLGSAGGRSLRAEPFPNSPTSGGGFDRDPLVLDHRSIERYRCRDCDRRLGQCPLGARNGSQPRCLG
ncbi:hypothetical protein N136_02284 [Leifsonia aquatica ATCC 14665]|uniref:Uncharacterized protein n=1 Tax=Leifsonia aquatica ATCC 14665 TaxID=1358026 RepID=U2T9J3_LEIAQ|nr:hypothetical protein N136_02284 [Leifsonia aquatica ATCC 14665]